MKLSETFIYAVVILIIVYGINLFISHYNVFMVITICSFIVSWVSYLISRFLRNWIIKNTGLSEENRQTLEAQMLSVQFLFSLIPFINVIGALVNVLNTVEFISVARKTDDERYRYYKKMDDERKKTRHEETKKAEEVRKDYDLENTYYSGLNSNVGVNADFYQEATPSISCPRCYSRNTITGTRGFSGKKAASGGILAGPIGLIGGFHGSSKVQLTCLECGHEWRPG